MYQPITPLFPLFHLQINFLFYFKERKVELATPRPLEDVQRKGVSYIASLYGGGANDAGRVFLFSQDYSRIS
jgi:hypothetical protein